MGCLRHCSLPVKVPHEARSCHDELCVCVCVQIYLAQNHGAMSQGSGEEHGLVSGVPTALALLCWLIPILQCLTLSLCGKGGWQQGTKRPSHSKGAVHHGKDVSTTGLDMHIERGCSQVPLMITLVHSLRHKHTCMHITDACTNTCMYKYTWNLHAYILKNIYGNTLTETYF